MSQAETTTAVDTDTSPSVFSGPVDITATVSPVSPGTGVPSGTVVFRSGATTIDGCAAQPLTSGEAVCATTSLAVGAHSLTAEYSGDTNFTGSTSPTDSHSVTKADSTTTVNGAPNPSTWQQDVLYTASISPATPATATPGSGTVDFKADDVPIAGCQDAPVATGSATCTTGLSPTGSPQITAEYSGDASFNASVSPPAFQVVNQAATATDLVSAPNPSVFSEPVELTATVTSDSGTPTGNVAFQIAGTSITGCATRPLSAGVTTCTVTTLPAGTTSITATYGGDVNFATSTSTPEGQVVSEAATTTAVESSDSTSSFNVAVTFTATIEAVAPAAATPNAGTVSFAANGDPISGCTTRPVAGGTATCETASLPVGDSVVTATYSGTDDFVGSVSPDFTQSVAKAATSTAVQSGTNPSVFSAPVVFAANVTSTAGTPTGTVVFEAAGTEISGCAARPLSSGTATCTTSALPVATTSVTATYGSDDDFAASTSTPVQQVVGKALSLTDLESADPTTTWHQPVTLTATIEPQTPATATPTGTVTFTVGGAAIEGCSARPMTSGNATCETDDLPIGDTSVTATYSGDASFLTSSSPPATQTVTGAPTSTALTSDEPSSRYGQPVTFTATVTSTAGTPSGTVSFYAVERDSSETLLATKSLSAGLAGTTTANLPVRNDSPILAKYNGAATFQPSEDDFEQTVHRSFSRTLLSSSANPSRYGRLITLTAEVNAMVPGGGQPSGKVAFYRVSNGPRKWIGTAPLAGGVATLRTSQTPIGVSSMIAEYSGGPNHRPSTRTNQQRVKP